MTASSPKKILAVSDYILTPLQEGGALRLFGILRAMLELGREVAYLPRTDHYPHQDGRLEEAVAYLRDHGIQVPGDARPQAFRDHLESQGREYDAVLLSGAYTAQACLSPVRRLAPRAFLIYDTVDLHHRRLFREAKLSASLFHLRQALAIKKSELLSVQSADLTLAVTTEEKEALEKECPGRRVFLLSNVHEVPPSVPGPTNRSDLLFLGAFHHSPNLDAIHYFLDELFPQIQARLPQARLQVIGSNPPPALLDRGGPRILIRGFVPDLEEAMSSCRLSVAPLRFGAGVKGKILASMGYGVPVVASSLAAEGMELRPERNVLLADDPESFAGQVERLFRQDRLWEDLSAAGRRWVERNYSPAATRAGVEELLAECETWRQAQP